MYMDNLLQNLRVGSEIYLIRDIGNMHNATLLVAVSTNNQISRTLRKHRLADYHNVNVP